MSSNELDSVDEYAWDEGDTVANDDREYFQYTAFTARRARGDDMNDPETYVKASGGT